MKAIVIIVMNVRKRTYDYWYVRFVGGRVLWHQKRVELVEKGGEGTKTGAGGSKMGASRSKMSVGGLKTDVGESKRF